MITFNKNVFVWSGPFEDREKPRKAGFKWSKVGKCWYTRSPYNAYLLRSEADYAAKQALLPVSSKVALSSASEPVLEYDRLYPFQAAGVEYAVDQMRKGRKHLLLADEQGLGKTIQAIEIANRMEYRKLLVICPATLRLNWCREIDRWFWYGLKALPYLKRGQFVDRNLSYATSYALAGNFRDFKPDMLIIDEAHYVKTPTTQRTKLILEHMVNDTPTVFLTGTPLPNGKPNELYPIINKCAPDILEGMSQMQYLRRFCDLEYDGFGGHIVRGARNQEELYARLRGSGFMTRRLKKDVLKDLPPKRFKLVVFPTNSETTKIIKKEEAFSAPEIIKHGIPVGSALPELRREMGVAKIPQCLEYIRDALDSGTEKLVIFAHHVECVRLLVSGLDNYEVVSITGGTQSVKRSQAVDAFQSDENIRVFIGNSAAQEGITLTAASDVVLVEPDWVPGSNNQKIDRLHRIGQQESVLVHILVVEQSLDAKILSSAAYKQEDIGKVLDR